MAKLSRRQRTALVLRSWHYLPPTKANLAMLRVPIPPGYPRSR